jgi:hypothetical protein
MNSKLAVTILFLFSVISCSTSTQENAIQPEPAADTLKQAPVSEAGETESAHHDEEEAVVPLSLNNGMKWKADDPTNENVKAIRKVVSNFESKQNLMLHDYHNASQEINNAINTLLTGCKMTGAEHEALHQWLLPLIDNTKKLLDSKEAEESAKIFSAIKEQLNLYNHYFD